MRDISPLCSLELCSCSYDTKTRFRLSSTPAARVYPMNSFPFLKFIRGLSLHDLTSIRAKKKKNASAQALSFTKRIIRPLNNDSLVQEDGNKAPCYPANTVIARSAHNGTLATHSFRTHEPTEFRRKGVNLVNKFKRTSFSF